MNLTKICIKKEQNITIDAEKLKEYIKKVENGKKVPDIEGVTIKKNKKGKKTVLNMEVEGVINGDLDIRWTNIKFQLGIIKKINEKKLKINGHISFGGIVKGIEKLCNDENLIIPGNLDIEGTKVRKIKAKKVLGYIWAKGVKKLERIEITEGIINGNLDIRGTSVDFQLDIIKKIEEKKLKINGHISFGGNIEGIKQLCNNKDLIIPGSLDIKGTSVRKINLKKLLGGINADGVETLEGIEVEEGIINGGLNIRWTNIKKINLKKVLGDILANGLTTLEEIKVEEEILGGLNISQTKVRKIKSKKVLGSINADGVETLEGIEVEEGIGGDLSIKLTSVDFQRKILEQKENGKLKINGQIFYDKVVIDAIKLKEYIENVEKTKKDYNKDGIEIKWISKKNVVDVGVKGIIYGDLDIEGTKVRKIKAKAIQGNINTKGAQELEEIEIEIEGKINGDLDIRGTSVDFQLGIIEKIEDGDLKITGEISFGGNIEGIEKLCNNKDLIIPGNLDIRGTSVKKINLKKVLGYINANGVITLEEIEITEGIEGNLDIRWTKVKTIKSKKVLGSIDANGLITLKEIDVEEEIGGDLNISQTKVKTIKSKKVLGSINANGVITLEEINITEGIEGNLNIRGTSARKITAKKIIGYILADGVETLEEINITEGIEGNLNIRGTSAKFQKDIIKKINKEKIKINGEIFYDKEAINTLNIIIDAEELKEYIKNVEETKKDYIEGGIEIKWINKKNAVDVEVKGIINGDLDIRGTSVDLQLGIIEKEKNGDLKITGEISFGGNIEGIEKLCNDENLIIPGNLDIRGTSVKKINLKKVLGYINANGVITLKKIEVTEGIDGDLNIRWTKVKTIKIKKVLGSINANGLITLEEIDVEEEIGGDLNIRGTKVKTIKIKKVLGSINANGLITLEEIDVEEEIGGDLDIRGTNINFQKKILEKKKNGELKINGEIFYDKEVINSKE